MTAVIVDACANALLDSAVAAGLNTTPHMSLHTGFPPAGGNEVTGGSPAYARQPFTWNAAGARSRAIAASETFDVPAGTTVRSVAVYDAITAGTQKAWSPAGALARRAFSVIAGDLAGNTIQSPGHGLTTNDRVIFWPTIGAVLPTGLAEDTEHFVIATGLTADVFSVSLTQGGAAVDITAIGDGDLQEYVAEIFAGQGTYQVSTFAVTLPA